MRFYFGVVSWGTGTPSNDVNEGTDGEDSFEVNDLYLGKAKPNRVSIPTGYKKLELKQKLLI